MEDKKVLATVAGKEITEADLNREMQSMDEDKKQYMDNPFYREECLSLLIDTYVFEKYGEEIGADEEEEFLKVFENTKRDMLAKFVISKKFFWLTLESILSPILLSKNHVGTSGFLTFTRDFSSSNSFEGKGVIALCRETKIKELNSEMSIGVFSKYKSFTSAYTRPDQWC